MKLSNDVEKYENEVTKMGQTTHCFLECSTFIVNKACAVLIEHFYEQHSTQDKCSTGHFLLHWIIQIRGCHCIY